ncbi:MAG TPA: mechanosensitive ion channel family protein [Verrucomicrobiae bacterium]|jgi:small-conductance mechanosensitive channel|nr:mechanosensitive ion channel family protein [Verrucomicrobiae bacterium]
MKPQWTGLLRDWNTDLLWWLRHGGPKLIAILVGMFVLIRLLRLITDKVVALSKRKSISSVARTQQIRTVAGVIHSGGVFVIVFVAFMQALPLFNIDIKPLLASAGIAGLTIGFGAQTLVKDVINGFFILVEDQFQVGDTVRTAGVTGIVEEITMRHTSLRDGDGTLHIVPNSAMQVVSNMTRDWSQVAMQVAVDYSENGDRVIQILQDVARELYNDAAFHADIVAEPEVPGIERIAGQEVDYLLLVKVRPGQQYGVTRELRKRIRASFEQNNIKAWTPVQVYIGQPPPAKSN